MFYEYVSIHTQTSKDVCLAQMVRYWVQASVCLHIGFSRCTGDKRLLTVLHPWGKETDVSYKFSKIHTDRILSFFTVVYFLFFIASVFNYYKKDCGDKKSKRMFSGVAWIQLIRSIYGLIGRLIALQRALVIMQDSVGSPLVSVSVLIFIFIF